MTPPRSDLTAQARIRDAALELFAERGIEAASIRDIAATADVSPGLVQHHFGTKSGLRDAVNAYVVALAGEAFHDLPSDGDPTEIQQEAGNRVTAFVRDHEAALRYVARAVADRDPGALQIFDAFVGIARERWETIGEHGLLRDEVVPEWAAMQVVLLSLGAVLMRTAVERHLPAPFTDPVELERWNQAQNLLFRHGLYKSPPDPGRPPAAGVGAETPSGLHSLYARLANAGDLDALVNLYEPDAVFISPTGERAQGTEAIRAQLGPALMRQIHLEMKTNYALPMDDIALLSSHWRATLKTGGETPGEARGTGTELARRQSDGRWLLVLDAPAGLEDPA